ncbi:broad substrate specificity ATP-binding cassette transporter ABCG2-like [Lethenteron reissneri]|uniref:broad substrate specificity ATP-binding cassette transporter ABCG2-like n=1 Tax=Lethenteron reissneri TaxID=7753 RepID=UPI002AB77B12|nr:broad substrate specificity ATP-binding cassette transporter ABCG2-like [Lethenteron reissneri]
MSVSPSERSQKNEGCTVELGVGGSPGDDSTGLHGSMLSYQGIIYSVNEGHGIPCRRKHKTKMILRDVSGIMLPGMNAIMGPTGSGKTSLLDVLAGRKDPKGLKGGTVLLDGNPMDSGFRLISGYVVQDDVIMGTLSVRENIEFSANLRLAQQGAKRSDWEQEKQQRVDNVIRELGLTECQNTKVGTDMIRGVSGGERKRCNIGMELITSPSVLFLDEPTTGLDANTATAIIRLLYRLSRNGRTVIFSIHQPRYSIFQNFDRLTLMHHGEVVFHGPSLDAVPYFSSIGYECEAFNNPPDFFLDVINGEILLSGHHGIGSGGRTAKSVGKQRNGSCNDDDDVERGGDSMEKGGGLELAQAYKSCHHWADTQRRLEGIGNVAAVPVVIRSHYATRFHYQLYIVCGRTVKNMLRNPQTSFMQYFINTLFAVLVGLIYWQISDEPPAAIQNRMGVFFFLIINLVFANLSAVELFLYERVLFMHESSSGYYRTSAYFLSKVFADLLPNRIVPIVIFAAISYFMIGLRLDVVAFFLFALTLVLTSLAAVSLAFLVSASVSIFAVANALIAIPYVFMMVFGGFLVNLNTMLDWLSWIKYVSIFRYGMNALSINEMKDVQYCSNMTCMSGSKFLEQQGIDYSLWGFWQNQLALAVMTVVFMILAYVQMLRINRWK